MLTSRRWYNWNSILSPIICGGPIIGWAMRAITGWSICSIAVSKLQFLVQPLVDVTDTSMTNSSETKRQTNSTFVIYEHLDNLDSSFCSFGVRIKKVSTVC